MSIETVRSYLAKWNRDKDIIELSESTATVSSAAAALGVVPARIAKTISVKQGAAAAVIVTSGDVKLDNHKYKDKFGVRVNMLTPQEALAITGHPVGGICPFGLPVEVAVFLDLSLKRFHTVFPACGSNNSAIELTLNELEEYSRNKEWVDVCVQYML
ncbi:MAG: YbaK/EbsC family protein [Treponema sp.]|jgi:prolyl-tRNA editing enzyme YbaK/EbsC (Cys-tRNA(Pro) deacylase)|nr:YbaK/EbsC family protein [Treponema sp.]